MSIIVPPFGRSPNPILLIGEAPGEEESRQLRPFVGRSGQEQERYLSRHNLSTRPWRLTNIISEYTEGNPDPTQDQIDYWTPHLVDEIHSCNPRLIIAVGRFAARWFLGESTELETVHGLPHRPGAFDPTLSVRCPDHTIILPIYHPALGFYDVNSRAAIAWDYGQVANTVRLILSRKPVEIRSDEWEGRETYLDVSGSHLISLLESTVNDLGYYPWIGIDTEGTPEDPFSIQISPLYGTGYLLRVDREDFHSATSYLQSYITQPGVSVVIHNAMYDLEMCRVMGLDLSSAQIFDTMYAAYLTRIEAYDVGEGSRRRRSRQGLKPLAWRWCGMQMVSHDETVGILGTERQIDYLRQITEMDYRKPDERIIEENDGTARLYRPQPIQSRAKKILSDIESGKIDKNGNPPDPVKRWYQIDKELRRPVEKDLGNIPHGSMRALYDRDPSAAIRYSARDADAALRLSSRLQPELSRNGLTQLMTDGMEILHVFEEMQSNGMPASRKYFEDLYTELTSEMRRLQSLISNRYYDGDPFNPGSSDYVASLMRRRGLYGMKRTPTGKVSTGKKSIEHLRYTDEAMKLVFEWREIEHVRDAFCSVILDAIPEDQDYCVVRCQILNTRTATRRLASRDPNLLAIPVRTDIGRRIREGFCLPPDSDEVLGSWDLSQVEMRIAAHLSGDETLCDLFCQDRDIHDETAVRFFKLPMEVIKSNKFKYRVPTKNALYGTVYGLQDEGLLDQLRMNGAEGWTKQSCGKLIRSIFEMYPGLAKYIKDASSELVKTKDARITDHWGMPRYLPAIWSSDYKESAEAGRHAVSHKIQGTAQGLIQKSIIWLRPIIRDMQLSGLNVKWRLQVHDEIILSFDRELWDMLNDLVIDALTNHCGMELRVPVKAEGAMGKSWNLLK